MFDVCDGGEGADERRDVGCGMKERRVLLHKEIGHLPAAISWHAEP